MKKEAPTVTIEHLESLITREYYHVIPDTTTTICVLTVKNGFTVFGKSACVAAENFNKEEGELIARKDALSQLWSLEGYLLRQNLWQLELLQSEVKPVKIEAVEMQDVTEDS